MNYTDRRPRYQSPEYYKEKRNTLIWRIILGTLFVAIFLFGISFWSKHSSMRVEEINVSGVVYTNQAEVLNKTFQKMEGNYFGLLSRRNSFIFPRGQIKDMIFEEFPEVLKLRVDFESRNSINVRITEYQPVARWCNSECFLMDEFGYIFTKEPSSSGLNLITYRESIEGEPIRANYLDSELFNRLEELSRILFEKAQIKVTDIKQADALAFELLTKRGVELRVDREDDFLDVFDNLQTFLNSEDLSKLNFEEYEYIDLRFGNKVFYKARGGVEEEVGDEE